ncbi:hypothetical protein WG907_05190 [Sphingobium sp. AN558]|uniref:hypothetical protein n=1 Tax=Sphingobium sp. AN558 TaxID=3133442 RepID=UPI0030C153EB
MIYFSPSTRGFYDARLHSARPSDAVAISPARHKAMLDGQAKGLQIIASANGRPTLKARAAVDPRAVLLRRVKREAARRIGAVAPVWRQLNDQREPSAAGAARFAAIDAIRAASDAIEATIAAAPTQALAAIDVANHLLWPAE